MRPAATRAVALAISRALVGTILCVCAWLSITLCLAGQSSDSSATAQQAIANSGRAALEGNGKLAASFLQGVPRNHFAGKDVAYRYCMLKRFGPRSSAPRSPVTADPFVSSLLDLYETYWWQALMSPTERDSWSNQLLRDVSALLGESTVLADWDVAETLVIKGLIQRGYHAQMGLTPPLRELMIWRKQEEQTYDVELPEGSFPVRLALLDDFITRGWVAFARCDRSGNAGWATQDQLYAVAAAFPHGMNNDAFEASLLGHETQHFADLNQFPDLSAWQLEYRAKLTELYLSRESLRSLLYRFECDQGDDEQVPHLFANKRVLQSLQLYLVSNGVKTEQTDLSDVPVEKLREAAREVLIQDTRIREHETPLAGKR